MGSRILSRSFHVEPWTGDEGQDGAAEEDDGSTDTGGAAGEDAMDVDHAPQEAADEDLSGRIHETPDLDLDDSDDGDAESVADVAMVPMADMLNARYGSENVSLRVI